MLPLQARVNLGMIAMKGYLAFPKGPVLLKPYHQIVLCHIQYYHQIVLCHYQDTRWESLTLSAEMQSVYFTAPALLGQGYIRSVV